MGHTISALAAIIAVSFIFIDMDSAAAQRRGLDAGRTPAGKPLTVCCKICKGSSCRHLTTTADKCVQRGGKPDQKRVCSPIKRCCRLRGKYSRMPASNCRTFGGQVVRESFCRARPRPNTCQHAGIEGPVFHPDARTITATALLIGCPRGMLVGLRLREDKRLGPDRHLHASGATTGAGDTRLTVRYDCKASSGGMRVFAELIMGREKRQTRRISVNFCR